MSHQHLQNGQMKGKPIEGANTPALTHQILTYVPANADMDDLEVSFVCCWKQAAALIPSAKVTEMPLCCLDA